MFLNIITPSCRPGNLHRISQSINIPRENYRWIVVFDSEELPDPSFIPENCEAYAHKNPNSISGNSQRNFAIDMIEEGFVYFNDDDTTLHPELWDHVKDFDVNSTDILTFSQSFPDGSLRLDGRTIAVNHTDSHNFIVNRKIVKDTRWELDLYAADGVFAQTCALKSKNGFYIPKVLSIYNTLR